MLGSRHWGYEVSGPESHASCNQSAFGEPFEGLPQLGGSCDDQRLHLVDGLSPGLESRVLRGLQHADHLNLVHARFWSGMGYPGKHSTGCSRGLRHPSSNQPSESGLTSIRSIRLSTVHAGPRIETRTRHQAVRRQINELATPNQLGYATVSVRCIQINRPGVPQVFVSVASGPCCGARASG